MGGNQARVSKVTIRNLKTKNPEEEKIKVSGLVVVLGLPARVQLSNCMVKPETWPGRVSPDWTRLTTYANLAG